MTMMDFENRHFKIRVLSLPTEADKPELKIARIGMSSPGSKVNKLSKEFMEDLKGVLVYLQGKHFFATLWISDIDHQFIAGADIHLIAGVQNSQEAATLASEGQALVEQIEKLPGISIAAVDGPCLGGGLEFALCCQVILASDHSSTQLGLPEVQLGVLPGMGGTFRLPQRIGWLAALDCILTGRRLKPQRAEKMGLVQAVLPAARFEDQVLLWIQKHVRQLEIGISIQEGLVSRIRHRAEESWLGRKLILAKARQETLKKTGGHYPAPLKILDLFEFNVSTKKETYLKMEQKAFGELAVSFESKALIQLFLGMEEKKSLGKMPGASAEKIVGILGAGVMGGGLASWAADQGYQVICKDIQAEALALGAKTARGLLDQKLKRKRITKTKYDQVLSKIHFTLDYGTLKSAPLIIEAIVENLSVKQKVFQELEKHVSADCVLATNTSSLRVGDIAAQTQKPQRVLGLHFFNPVAKMPLVEVIKTEHTSPEALARGLGFITGIGKTPVVVKDSPGFLVNRILALFLNEACYLMEEGYSFTALDSLAREWGFPMGPGQLLDEVGLDVGQKVGDELFKAFGQRMTPCQLTRQVMDPSWLGRKSGCGFYKYDSRGKILGPNQDVVQKLAGARVPTDEVIEDRLVMPMILEASFCLEEKVVDTSKDLDLAMILGTGFPPFRGGLLGYADSLGMRQVVDRLKKNPTGRFAPSQFLLDKAAQNSTLRT